MKALKPFYKVIFYVLLCMAQVVIRLVYPVRAIGKENLKALKGEGFVLAPNHLKAIDPMFVVLARGIAKKMLIMGKDELFHISPVLNFFWHAFGTFPINRGVGDKTVVNRAVEEVKKGRGLLLFPEGTRSKDGKLGRLKSGAFVVAMQAGVPIVPCVIWYKAGKPKPFNRVTVVFGKPVSMQKLGLEGEYSAAKLREAKKLFSQQLTALYEDNKARL